MGAAWGMAWRNVFSSPHPLPRIRVKVRGFPPSTPISVHRPFFLVFVSPLSLSRGGGISRMRRSFPFFGRLSCAAAAAAAAATTQKEACVPVCVSVCVHVCCGHNQTHFHPASPVPNIPMCQPGFFGGLMCEGGREEEEEKRYHPRIQPPPQEEYPLLPLFLLLLPTHTNPLLLLSPLPPFSLHASLPVARGGGGGRRVFERGCSPAGGRSPGETGKRKGSSTKKRSCSPTTSTFHISIGENNSFPIVAFNYGALAFPLGYLAVVLCQFSKQSEVQIVR